MNLFTHIAISMILYKSLKGNIKVNRKAFIYGNIKPDLTNRIIEKPHILDYRLFDVCNHANRLMERNNDVKGFSVELGQICHYICDFFCQYHSNLKKYNHLFRHYLYEVKLQFVFLIRKKEIARRIVRNQNGPEPNIATIIATMLKQYNSEEATLSRDIYYGISAAQWVCESVSWYRVESTRTVPSIDIPVFDYAIPTIIASAHTQTNP